MTDGEGFVAAVRRGSVWIAGRLVGLVDGAKAVACRISGDCVGFGVTTEVLTGGSGTVAGVSGPPDRVVSTCVVEPVICGAEVGGVANPVDGSSGRWAGAFIMLSAGAGATTPDAAKLAGRLATPTGAPLEASAAVGGLAWTRMGSCPPAPDMLTHNAAAPTIDLPTAAGPSRRRESNPATIVGYMIRILDTLVLDAQRAVRDNKLEESVLG